MSSGSRALPHRLETGQESRDWMARATCHPFSLVLFFRNFALMFRAGLSLVHILETLTHQTEDPAFAEVLWTLSQEVQRGKTLSRAMSEFPRIFPTSVLALVRTGEESGAMLAAMELAGDWSQRCYELSRKVRAALTYPCFVLCVTVLGSLFLCITLLPDLLASVTQMGATLHWTTHVLVFVAWLVRDTGFWIMVVSLLGLGFLKGRDLLQSDPGRLAFASMVRGLPGVGPLFQSAALVRLPTTLHTMLASGGPLQVALRLAITSSGDALLERDLPALMSAVREGRRVSEYMATNPTLYPLMMVSMVSVGEESGKLAPMLAHVATMFERDANYRIETLATLAEPLLLVIVAGAVIFCLIGLLTPIYNLLSSF